MKKFVVGLTAALALGVMAAPSVTNAANGHGGSRGSSHASGSRGSVGGGKIAHSSVGRSMATRNVSGRNFANSARVTNRSRSYSGYGNNYVGYDSGGYNNNCWLYGLIPFGTVCNSYYYN